MLELEKDFLTNFIFKNVINSNEMILFIIFRFEPVSPDLVECRYNQNVGYVVFSAMGSFFIPMAVMIYVYVRISCVVASRHDHMTDIEVHKVSFVTFIGIFKRVTKNNLVAKTKR